MSTQSKPEMGKYLLWKFFSNNQRVRKYLPATRRYSLESLREFLNRYGTVYLKPVAGSRGQGILKAWKREGRIMVQKTVFQSRSFATIETAHQYIDKERAGKAYLVQQGIRLAKVGGRPFDIRVMMQRERPGGKWFYSGMMAKVAGKGSVVTNVALSKGSAMEVGDALRSSFRWSDQRIQKCTQELMQVSHQAAEHFDNYLKYRELGFDMAVDETGKVWMIEQNTGPSHAMFLRLKKHEMYHTIQRRSASYRKSKK